MPDQNKPGVTDWESLCAHAQWNPKRQKWNRQRFPAEANWTASGMSVHSDVCTCKGQAAIFCYSEILGSFRAAPAKASEAARGRSRGRGWTWNLGRVPVRHPWNKPWTNAVDSIMPWLRLSIFRHKIILLHKNVSKLPSGERYRVRTGATRFFGRFPTEYTPNSDYLRKWRSLILQEKTPRLNGIFRKMRMLPGTRKMITSHWCVRLISKHFQLSGAPYMSCHTTKIVSH